MTKEYYQKHRRERIAYQEGYALRHPKNFKANPKPYQGRNPEKNRLHFIIQNREVIQMTKLVEEMERDYYGSSRAQVFDAIINYYTNIQNDIA